MTTPSKIVLAALVLTATATTVGCAAPPAFDDVDETSGAQTAGDGPSKRTKSECEATQLTLPASLERLQPDDRRVSERVCLDAGRGRIDVTNAARTTHDGVLMVTFTVPRNDPDDVASSARLRVVAAGSTETQTLRTRSYTRGSGGPGVGDEPAATTTEITLRTAIQHLETTKGQLRFELQLPSTVKNVTASLIAAGIKGSECSSWGCYGDAECNVEDDTYAVCVGSP